MSHLSVLPGVLAGSAAAIFRGTMFSEMFDAIGTTTYGFCASCSPAIGGVEVHRDFDNPNLEIDILRYLIWDNDTPDWLHLTIEDTTDSFNFTQDFFDRLITETDQGILVYESANADNHSVGSFEGVKSANWTWYDPTRRFSDGVYYDFRLV